MFFCFQFRKNYNYSENTYTLNVFRRFITILIGEINLQLVTQSPVCNCSPVGKYTKFPVDTEQGPVPYMQVHNYIYDLTLYLNNLYIGVWTRILTCTGSRHFGIQKFCPVQGFAPYFAEEGSPNEDPLLFVISQTIAIVLFTIVIIIQYNTTQWIYSYSIDNCSCFDLLKPIA